MLCACNLSFKLFQLEVVFKSLYANVKVQPFGSSVNGFGRMGCDLDLVLTNALSEDMVSFKYFLS